MTLNSQWPIYSVAMTPRLLEDVQVKKRCPLCPHPENRTFPVLPPSPFDVTSSAYVSPRSGAMTTGALKCQSGGALFQLATFTLGAGLVLGVMASEVEKLLCPRWSGLEFHVQCNFWRCYKVEYCHFRDISCCWQVFTAAKLYLVMKEASRRSLKVSSKGIHELLMLANVSCLLAWLEVASC